MNFWLNGPDLIITEVLPESGYEDSTELEKTAPPQLLTAIVGLECNDLVAQYKCHNSFTRTRRHFAWLNRAIHNFGAKSAKLRTTTPYVERRTCCSYNVSTHCAAAIHPVPGDHAVEQKMTDVVQTTAFPNEIRMLQESGSITHKGPLEHLNPTLKDDLIRVQGRLGNAELTDDARLPILVPESHPFSRTIIRHIHEHNFHAGTELVMSESRTRFWMRDLRLGDDNLPVGRWPIGIITKTYVGPNGIVRVADVRSGSGIYKRDVRLLAPLPMDAIEKNEDDEPSDVTLPANEGENGTRQPTLQNTMIPPASYVHTPNATVPPEYVKPELEDDPPLTCNVWYLRTTTPYVERRTGPLQLDELESGLQLLLRLVQTTAFPNEIRMLQESGSITPKGPLEHLNPTLKDNLKRVQGRLGNAELTDDPRLPILVPKSHTFSRTIICHIHEHNFHAGTELVMSEFRTRFWMRDLRPTVVGVISRCVFRASFLPSAAWSPFHATFPLRAASSVIHALFLLPAAWFPFHATFLLSASSPLRATMCPACVLATWFRKEPR
uniref:DUF5641 domain-containing protein n=1 Tax=Anopheles epiroticus TaxID=199890 RepID=A0A182PVJ6_9DIPT